MRENTRGYRRKTVNLHVELVSDDFTFDSYSLITVVTATAADLHIVDNNRLPFCRPIIYIKVLELEIKHKHGGFNINYEKATVVWQQFGVGS
jgi:hypothetical protein